MGHSKSSSKREVYRDTGLPQETRKISNNLNLMPKATKERRNKTKSQQKERNHKDQSKINEIETKSTIEKINETKSWFFDKPLARLIKKKREKSQINRIINEKGELTTDTAEIQSHERLLQATLCQ